MNGMSRSKHITVLTVALVTATVYFLCVSACIQLLSDRFFDGSPTAASKNDSYTVSNSEPVSSRPQTDNGSDILNAFLSSNQASDSESITSGSFSYVSSADVTPDSMSSTVSADTSVPSSSPTNSPSSDNTSADGAVTQKKSFTSAVWLSYGTDLNFKSDSSFSAFKRKIDTMFENIKDLGCDAVICQVRPFADAYYYSKYFPMSAYLSGTQGKDVGYDPLSYMITAAHSRGLQLHTWLNPYRISTSTTDVTTLSEKNIARKWMTDNDTSNDRYVLTYKNGLYFNPSEPEVQKLIINGVREIVENYDVDGIHFDDYFYPFTGSVDEDFDKSEYLASGSRLSLEDWRRANVNALISGVWRAVKAIDGDVIFGVSPAYNISKTNNNDNYNIKFADLAKWISTKGYIDYIAPQIYFGFEYPKEHIRYDCLVDLWLSMSRLDSVKLYIGLAAYKIGTVDAGSTEWQTEDDILAEQTVVAFERKCDGVFIFNYSTMFATGDLAQKQKDNLKLVLGIINSN